MSATLLEFVSDITRRRQLAERMECNPSYLWQIATGRRRASPSLAKEIEEVTSEIGPMTVRKESLRPDVWDEIAKNGSKHRRRAN